MATTTDSTDLVVYETPEQMISALRGEIVPALEDPAAAASAIAERILAAGNADEVLNRATPDSAQDVIGRPFTLTGLRLMRSRFEEGPGVFAVLEGAYLDDGGQATITCSGRNVMAQAVRLYQLDALPRDVKIEKAETETAAGFRPLWLVSADAA